MFYMNFQLPINCFDKCIYQVIVVSPFMCSSIDQLYNTHSLESILKEDSSRKNFMNTALSCKSKVLVTLIERPQ